MQNCTSQLQLQLLLARQGATMFDLTNQDFIRMIIGGSLLTVGKVIDSMMKNQANKYWKIKQDIQQWKKLSLEKNYLKLLDNSEKKINVVIQGVVPKIKNDTLKIRVREQPLHIEKAQCFQRVIGGDFTFQFMRKQVTAQINDTTIMGSALGESSKPVKIFGHMQPVVKSTQYFLRKGITLTVIGALSYNLQTKKLKIQPSIIGQNLMGIIDYYNDLYLLKTIPRVFTFMMMGFGIWFMQKPIKKFLKKIYSKMPWYKQSPHQQNLRQQEQFKNKVQFKASKKHVFECAECKVNITNIVYKCGHLCLCEQCHIKTTNENGGKMICKICKKSSKSFLKIFLS